MKQLGLCPGYSAGLAPARGIVKAGSHPREQATESVKTIIVLLPTWRAVLLGQPGKARGKGRQQLLLNRCLEEQQLLLCPAPAHHLKRKQTNPGPQGLFLLVLLLALSLFLV